MSSSELIYGSHAVSVLLHEAPERVLQIYLQQGRNDHAVQQIIAEAKTAGISVQYFARQKLDQLFPQKNHQGIAAKCRIKTQFSEADIPEILSQVSGLPLLLILDGVQDPHNLGACLRSADAAGVHLVLAPKDGATGLTPTVRKVACGAAETVPFIQVTNLARTLRMLRDQGIWLFGAAGEGKTSLYQADLKRPLALVLGAEGKGLRRLTRELCDDLIHIPMAGVVTSLNVSVATGISLFEAVRQRTR